MNTADAVQSFLYSRRSLNRRPATLKWYEKHLGRFIAFSAGLPTEPEPIERFLATVVADEQEESRHGYYRALKALYRFTCRRRRLLNPMDLIDPPARHKKVKPSLTAQELMLLLGRSPGLRETALLTFLADSACRAGEAASLRKPNIYEGYVVVDGKTGQRFAFISEETRRLLLNLAASNNNPDYVFLGQRGPLTTSGIYRIVNKYMRAAGITPPKMGPHRLRHCFGKNFILNGETVHMLAAYLARRPEAGNGRFFVGTKGGNLDRIYLYNLVRRYLKLAGINKSKRGPHLLRHTFCTRLHQKGVDPFTIKDLAGHKSLNTTMRYIRIENKEQVEAIDQLEFGTMNMLWYNSRHNMKNRAK